MAIIRSVIRGVGAYLPKRILTNAELAKTVDTSDDTVERFGYFPESKYNCLMCKNIKTKKKAASHESFPDISFLIPSKVSGQLPLVNSQRK